jgi:DNA modification methylase
VLDVLPAMQAESVSAVVCSPPYWGQRVYEDETPVGWGDGSLVAFGREERPEEYVAHSLQILKGLLRVLAPDGTVWWNIADSYFTRTIARTSSADRIQHYAGKTSTWAGNPHRRSSYGHGYLKDKDLSLVPFQIAIGAQRLGYWVRSVIVWSKQQAVDDFHELESTEGKLDGRDAAAAVHVPEVVRDRPVTAHEYILLLSRSERYEYDHTRLPNARATSAHNVRTVWTFPPAVWQGTQGARYPEELPRRCILLGSKEDDLVFDPFAGEGTTLRTAKALGRRYFGCDISKTYVRDARARVRHTKRELPTPAQPALLELLGAEQ